MVVVLNRGISIAVDDGGLDQAAACREHRRAGPRCANCPVRDVSSPGSAPPGFAEMDTSLHLPSLAAVGIPVIPRSDGRPKPYADLDTLASNGWSRHQWTPAL